MGDILWPDNAGKDNMLGFIVDLNLLIAADIQVTVGGQIDDPGRDSGSHIAFPVGFSLTLKIVGQLGLKFSKRGRKAAVFIRQPGL